MAEHWTPERVQEHYEKMGLTPPSLETAIVGALFDAAKTGTYAPRVIRPAKPQPIEGPVSETIVLWGHCPSKKNGWGRNKGSSGMHIDPQMKAEIQSLTTQALFMWKHAGPVEHPELTFRFFVHSARRDRDGMLTTVLDLMQAAGILVNDNMKWNNGRTVMEPVCFVAPADERVEILIEKR